MASPPPPAPQLEPCAAGRDHRIDHDRTGHGDVQPSDQARLRPQRSCSKKISALAAMGIKRLRHDADVGDAGLLDRVHDGGKGAEGNIFIGANKNGLMLRIANFLLQLGADLVDVDRRRCPERRAAAC